MDLNTSVLSLPGLGTFYSKRLENLNIKTFEDLIYHFPFRYDDFSSVGNINEAKIGEKVIVLGEIWSIKNSFTRNKKFITTAVFNDGVNPIELTWFNQSWLTKQIKVGDKLKISGKLSKYKNKLSIIAPVWERRESLQFPVISLQTTDSKSLVPVYPETAGITSKFLRNKISEVFPQIQGQITDPLPEELKGGMLNLEEALKLIHFPASFADAQKARQRLSFDEMFFLQLATLKTRLEWKNKPTIEKLQVTNYKLQIQLFVDKLPFKLTNSQEKVLKEIFDDLGKEQPMNRLVQGEVGSGKTIVAAITAYFLYLNNLRTLYMAPTEVLAFQHFSTMTKLLEPLGIKVGIYTGSKKYNKVKSYPKHALESGSRIKPGMTEEEPDIIIGTHALLSEKLTTENVGLVIIDEQQRFGVEQRTVLRNKGTLRSSDKSSDLKAKIPHFLTMTATPIPRTVALTLYGDLDLSIIDEMPKGRKQVLTYVVPNKKRLNSYEFIRKHVEEGEQVYIITPLIEQSETLVSAKAAIVEYERLKNSIFPDLRVGLLHGRLKSKEKEEVLNAFKDHKLDILVSTSVVEVGVDVPNATIMVIEGADRFGLAQLHQLRGRVGRGEKQSYCLLFPTSEESNILSRLKNLEKIYDGMKLSELDLKIRGSGDLFGVRQSGRLELKIADFSDLSLIEKTRNAARKLLDEDPRLEKYPKLRLKLQNLAANVMPD